MTDGAAADRCAEVLAGVVAYFSFFSSAFVDWSAHSTKANV